MATLFPHPYGHRISTTSTDATLHLTLATAQALQDTAIDCGTSLMGFVSNADPAYPSKVTARAFTADHRGGVQLPGAFVADSLDELRAMMPAELTRRDRAPVHPPEIVETWD